MTAAVFGLLGVIVGGFLNGFVTYRLEVRKERAAARAAARLLMAPAHSAWAELDFAISVRKWWPLRYGALEEVEAVWNEHRQLLAAHGLSLDDWTTVLKDFDPIFAVYRGAAHVVQTAEETPRDRLAVDDVWVGLLG